MDNTENTEQFVERRYSSTLSGIVTTVEWVIIALVLAFVFRAFIMEAFRIPTGSMAETLRGVHHHLRCEQCGYKADYDADISGVGRPKCSSCGFEDEGAVTKPASNGDRILVLKCIYEFIDPRRWDVVVFKNPDNPDENYIKRMIGLPGETIATLDGDFYVNGTILRKPPKVQNEMWMPIYDNDFQPVITKGEGAQVVKFDWKQPFVRVGGGQWLMNPFGETYFMLESEPTSENTIAYDSRLTEDFNASYAYNETTYRTIDEPLCTDLRIRFYAHRQSDAGFVGASIRKYDCQYRGRVSFDGQMTIEKVTGDEVVVAAKKDVDPFDSSRGVLFDLSIVDRQVILQFGKEQLKYELGDRIEDLSFVKTRGSLVEISGAGDLKLSHVAVYRDTYYTDKSSRRPKVGIPFKIGEDEFFVCGDNSPNSHDSRKWEDQGKGNNGKRYTTGIVPRDYLMGKAFFLYWGDAFMPLGSRIPIIPNFSEMKIIYGGSGDQL
jgi:signal peptidase I